MQMMSFLDFLFESAKRNNFGEDFEKKFVKALESFSSKSNTISTDNDMQMLAKNVLSKFILKQNVEVGKRYNFEVKNESQADKKRKYLVVVDDRVVLNDETTADMGAKLTDVTVNYKGNDYYISLKANNTLCFATIGLKTLGIMLGTDLFKQFLEDMFMPPDDQTIDDICSQLHSGLRAYKAAHRGKSAKKARSNVEDKLRIPLTMTDTCKELLKRMIGYGYIYVWYNKSTGKCSMFEMTEDRMNKIVDAFDTTIQLEPFCKNAKIAYFKFDNPYIDSPRWELKDNHGAGLPDQIKFVYLGMHSANNDNTNARIA